MSTEDIYDFEDRDYYDEQEGYFECSCGWFGDSPNIIKEFGMVFYICPACSGEVY